MINLIIPRQLRSAIAAGALLSLGGCMYGGGGVYSESYAGNRGYDCDPYAPFDDYYACDYGYGFANIGYGGGWYDQYYYPGYGVYVFDRGGKRHAMRNDHRRYWARQRAQYGGHYGRGRNSERRDEQWDRRQDRRDGSRDPRRGNYRDDRGVRGDRGVRDNRGYRPRTGVTRPDGVNQAAPVRNRGDRARPVVNRPIRAVEQPQARPQPVARPVPQRESRRISPRTIPSDARNVVDE